MNRQQGYKTLNNTKGDIASTKYSGYTRVIF